MESEMGDAKPLTSYEIDPKVKEILSEVPSSMSEFLKTCKSNSKYNSCPNIEDLSPEGFAEAYMSDIHGLWSCITTMYMELEPGTVREVNEDGTNNKTLNYILFEYDAPWRVKGNPVKIIGI